MNLIAKFVRYYFLNKLTEGERRNLINAANKKEERIAIYWGVIDIVHVGVEKHKVFLTNEQAMYILQLIDRRHDANYGITWDTLDDHVSDFIRDKKIVLDPNLCLCASCQTILTSNDERFYEDNDTEKDQPYCAKCFNE